MITIEDLKKLPTISGPCLTIFAPVRDPFSQVTKADTRVIAAVQKADELLLGKEFNQIDRENFLRPITKLANNTDWSGRTGSVVIFRAPGFTQATFWPDFLDARVTLGDEFFILPLLRGLGAERNFWVLALSINKIRLLRGAGKALTEFELPRGLASNLADFLAFDNPDHDLEGRSAGGPSSGRSGTVRFGTSSVPESEAAHLHDYFKAIERAIHPILTRNGPDPLILAAVPRELALYRPVNTYAPLVDEAIHGSPDALGWERLHKSALELLARHNNNGAEKYRCEIEAAAGRRLLLTDPAEIVPLARSGQVARLFVNGQANANSDTNTEPLINVAALAVLNNSGTVTCCNSLIAPGGVAAILRFRVPAQSETEPETAPAGAAR